MFAAKYMSINVFGAKYMSINVKGEISKVNQTKVETQIAILIFKYLNMCYLSFTFLNIYIFLRLITHAIMQMRFSIF